ncbi:MAG: Rpn family recombination-promoting nuclease/putative transposase [Candidatus Midichloria sp.]
MTVEKESFVADDLKMMLSYIVYSIKTKDNEGFCIRTNAVYF